jgi:hypothetical protein
MFAALATMHTQLMQTLLTLSAGWSQWQWQRSCPPLPQSFDEDGKTDTNIWLLRVSEFCGWRLDDAAEEGAT